MPTPTYEELCAENEELNTENNALHLELENQHQTVAHLIEKCDALRTDCNVLKQQLGYTY